MSYDVILFDADGVTIHSEMMFSQKLEQDYGIPMEKMLPFFKGVFQECLFGQADLKEELEKVIGDWGWKKTVDEMLKEWFVFENRPDQKMFDFIKELRTQGIKCYLATNQEIHRGKYLREEMDFNHLFDGLFISAEVGYKKKDPKFFEKIYEQIGEEIPKDHTLFIDDEEENINAAKQVGIATYLFDDLEKLKAFLEK